jgi:hypothetical protein
MARRTLIGIGAIAGVVAVFLVAIIVFAGLFALNRPGRLGSGPTTNIRLETTGAVGSAVIWPRPNDPHPDWVGYLPTTILTVPANSTIRMEIDQDDSATGLRNPFWAKVQGVDGGSIHMKYYDDSGNLKEGDFSTVQPDTPAHTFAIPELGVFVPLMGLSPNAPAGSYNQITFTFHTGKAGKYRWQCFVPCAAGYLYGNGGPMQTLGYMGGFLIVQ